MARILHGKRAILGVSGGIAAYKAIEIARDLTLAGVMVDVMMTSSALQFVTPLTFQTLTRRKVYTEVFEPWTEEEHGHITMAEEADVMIIAPATANTIAKLVYGLADDMLTVSALACVAPLVVAPAMDHNMYLHPATQHNLRLLAERGAKIVGPDTGPLASGAVGHGRLVPASRVMAAIRAALGKSGPLAGKRVVVSAGPTRERIDPIRFLSNRSTGKMGYAIAESFIDAGASVTLVSGPTNIEPPPEAELVRVESAAEMAEAVDRAIMNADVLVMAAAVADYTPANVADQKIKKTEGPLTIELGRTVDILATVNRPGLLKIGFAAETNDLLANARRKVMSKGADLIVANEATATMGSDESQAYFLLPDADPEPINLMHKSSLADEIVDRVSSMLASRHNGVETS